MPYIEAKNATAQFEHEATTSKISEDQKFYVMQRGIPEEEAIALIVNGFVKDVIQELPMEFAVEAQKLIGIYLKAASAELRPSTWTVRRMSVCTLPIDCRSNATLKDKKMLEIKNLHARIAVDRHRDHPRAEPDRRSRRGRRDHGAERLRQIDAVLRARRPRRTTR